MSNCLLRTTCRLCGNGLLARIFMLPSLPPVDDYRPKGADLSRERFDISPHLCLSCGHVQIVTVVDPRILYENYTYHSSSSPDLDSHFTSYADKLMRISTELCSERRILDIGSNDGLFLSKCRRLDFDVLGVDPSDEPVSEAEKRGIRTVKGFFGKELSEELVTNFGTFDFITANNVFSHSDDIDNVVEGVITALSEKGVFVFEVSYLLDTVRGFVLDYIYHEHLDYHSMMPLDRYLRSKGLTLKRAERLQTKGGSIRCFAVKTSGTAALSSDGSVDKLTQEESACRLHSLATLRRWGSDHEIKCDVIRREVQHAYSLGMPIVYFGASATSVVLAEISRIAGQIDFIVDDHPRRHGMHSPLRDLLVKAPLDVLDELDSYLVVIGAWRHKELILNKYSKLSSEKRRFISFDFGHFDFRYDG